ncbi:hypothetical protein Lesp02_56530 [Lentzea sp. NBRC 105346]|uniref:DUF742 domain-containing protein n=1 Tax=Lentzea sp. NBRC 105346 TaxID=3032205 RepID=UPI00249F9E3B|nr:DUF742 domain-containing protein [Lentzea sp. NBRC 105346]GLZ33465.1 hypothetical protein Lesp02_56530 [Lentzea sp. NBRC 105346]
MSSRENWWYDEAAGPLVRPYAMVRGRTRPAGELHLITQVLAMPTVSDPSSLSVDHREILDRCARPTSVAELAAHLNVPLVVVKVLLSDLLQRGDIVVHNRPHADVPDRNLLQAVLDGVRGL